jgi:hypothetical protein
VEIKRVRNETSRKISVKPRRNSSSTIMPLNASSEGVPDAHSQTVAAAAPTRPINEIVPVTQRCVGRPNASTSMTSTATEQTITSGAISDQLMTGISSDCASTSIIPPS